MKFKLPRIGRAVTANILMGSFIIMTSVGAFCIDVSAGFITLGVASGLIGFILGME
jgi:hypothetical protein